MRAVYKNPKELATFIKDSVDSYSEGLITYEKLKDILTRVIQANEDSVYKNGIIPVKLSNALGQDRVDIINDMFDK